jgi:hypothetical protein
VTGNYPFDYRAADIVRDGDLSSTGASELSQLLNLH